MLQKRTLKSAEKSITFKAGLLSIGVHVVLLIALLISVNWKTTHPVSISDVELWESLPDTSVIEPPTPPISPVKEVPKPVPKVAEEKIKEEVKPALKVDIALEKQKVPKAIEKEKTLEPKKEVEKFPKPKEVVQKDPFAALKEELRSEALNDTQKPAKRDIDALKKLQQETLAEDKNTSDQVASGAKNAANAALVDEFKSKINVKIRGNVNKSLCGNGNPELKFKINLLPTGQLSASPLLVKSSGNLACDEAVERAIRASEPLPLPKDSDLFSQFKELTLIFRPNVEN